MLQGDTVFTGSAQHYTGQIIITISMKHFFLEIKHLGETTEAIQTAPFDVRRHIVAHQKNQLFAFTYLPAPAITISTLLQSQMKGSTSNKTFLLQKTLLHNSVRGC